MYLFKFNIHEADRDDAMQDILISIHLSRHTYNSNKPFGPWFVSILKRRLIDRFRVSKRFISENIEDHLNITSDLDKEIENKILLNDLLNKLEPEKRVALEGTSIYGYSTEELAKKLNMNSATLRVLIHRTLKKLKNLIDV